MARVGLQWGLDPRFLVSVAQLVERWIVAPVAVGSNPITHPLLLQNGPWNNDPWTIFYLELEALSVLV